MEGRRLASFSGAGDTRDKRKENDPVPRIAFLSVVLWLALSGAARAQAPRTIPFHFRLTSSAGTPVSVPVSVRFSLYTAPSGGTAVWTESKVVTPVSGIGDTMLGDATPFNAVAPPVNFGVPYYLGVKVGTDAEMQPRLPLGAVPYALSLPNVTVDSTGRVGIGTATPQVPLQVAGDILLGGAQTVTPVGGTETLRTIRGMVSSTGGILLGSGFTVTRSGGVGSGGYDIHFDQSFSGIPDVVCSAARYGQASAVTELAGVSNATVRTYVGSSATDSGFHFIAIGPRD
jgi:hypothetical protein